MRSQPLGGTRVPPSAGTPAGSAVPGPEAVDVPAACRVLGISRTKLYDLLGSGVLPSVKIGRRRLVRLETARNLLAALERSGIERGAA
jgi:excisionase family DNA binding protein